MLEQILAFGNPIRASDDRSTTRREEPGTERVEENCIAMEAAMTPDAEEVLSDCVNASNSSPECADYSFRRNAETKAKAQQQHEPQNGRRTAAVKDGEAVKTKEAVVAAAEALVQNVMGSWDGSHDPFHAFRVRSLSLSLASEEGLPSDSLYVVELAALLHDIDDHKYASKGPRDFPTAEEFLVKYGVETEKRETVLTIIRTMGFKEELSGSSNQTCVPELRVVQDADRLDAMGAIGIGRTFTYGGSRNNAMHDPAILPRSKLTKDEYMNNTSKQTTINHFHEKLLKLKHLMKTQAGKKRAERRHKFMENFLSQFHKEWYGEL